MKIFLLAVTILLFISRIKNTPRMLSRNLYRKNMQRALDNNKKSFDKLSEDNIAILQGAAILLILILEMLAIVYYILIGSRFSSNAEMLVLSALQIVTTIITLKRTFGNKLFSQDVEDYKFYRWYFLFNVVLDYIYYPMTIYMLLK